MHPVLFELGSFRLFTWGVMLAVSMSLGFLVMMKTASMNGYDRERLATAVMVLIVAGVTGARLAYVLTNPSGFAGSGIMGLLDLRAGGMAFHGSLLLGIAVLPALARHVGIGTLRLADTIAPGLALGYGVQRIGCFLNGDSYGTLTDLPWAATTRFAAGLRHPVQLYDSIMNIGLFLLLAYLAKRRVRVGRILVVYLAGSGLARFVSEFFRDGARVVAWVTPAQFVSLGLILSAVVVYAFGLNRERNGRVA